LQVDRARTTTAILIVLSAAATVGGARAATLSAAAPNALIEAVQADDRASVARLLATRPNLDARLDDGSTALAWAAIRCNDEIALLLMKAGANPNITNDQGVGPLYIAIQNGSTSVVRILLAHGANPNLARVDGETPLMLATRLGQIDVTKMLLDRHAEVNAREKKFDQTALMWAAGHPAATRMLLDHGADIHAVSRTWKITATIYTPTTSTIGKTGIPWNNDGTWAGDQGGQNALLFDVQQHDLESARMLLGAGVDVNIRAADGTTPLLAALYKWDPLGKEFVAGSGAPAASGSSAHFGADIQIANFLLDRGANVKVADSAGYTPLHGAALAVAAITTGGRDRSAYGNGRALKNKKSATLDPESAAKLKDSLALVRRLLDAGADPNQQTLYPTEGPVGDVRINPAPPGSSPFHIAANSDCLELVQLLADKGANPNLFRKDGHTPFSVSVLSLDLPIVKEMVARGANLSLHYNPTDHFADPVKPISLPRSNQSIMHIAAGAGAPDIIEYLHSLGVGLNAKNSMGETPLDLADHQERYREARDREGAEDKPNRVVKRDTSTTDMIKKLLGRQQSPAR
jgi:ankyrin repeat protein